MPGLRVNFRHIRGGQRKGSACVPHAREEATSSKKPSTFFCASLTHDRGPCLRLLSQENGTAALEGEKPVWGAPAFRAAVMAAPRGKNNAFLSHAPFPRPDARHEGDGRSVGPVLSTKENASPSFVCGLSLAPPPPSSRDALSLHPLRPSATPCRAHKSACRPCASLAFRPLVLWNTALPCRRETVETVLVVLRGGASFTPRRNGIKKGRRTLSPPFCFFEAPLPVLPEGYILRALLERLAHGELEAAAVTLGAVRVFGEGVAVGEAQVAHG